MTEHGVLKRLLLAYQAASAQLAAGHVPPEGAISDAAQVIADFVEGFHEGLEEAYVFPRVRADHAELVQTLLTQHDRGRHLTAAISVAASGDLTTAAARGTGCAPAHGRKRRGHVLCCAAGEAGMHADRRVEIRIGGPHDRGSRPAGR